MISGLEGSNRGSDLLHDPDTLMSEDPARLARRHIPLQDVQVGAANGGLRDPHDRIAGCLQGRPRAILETLLAGAMINESFHDLLRSTVRRVRQSVYENDRQALMIDQFPRHAAKHELECARTPIATDHEHIGFLLHCVILKDSRRILTG